MTGPLHSSDLDDVLDTLTEIEDDDLNRIITGFRNIAHRAHTGQLDLTLTQVLIAALAASPDNTDVIGACAYLIAELTDHNPALDQLTNDHRKEATKAGQEAAYHLTRPELREHASWTCAALDTLTTASGQCSKCGQWFPDWNGGTCGPCQATGSS